MNPQTLPGAANPTPAPLHDIAAPVAYFPYPLWMVVAAALAALALVALLVWFFGFRRRAKARPSPREVALAGLGRLRAGVATTEPYAFSIAVSDLLRTYLRDARGVHATTQTSREFLESLRTRPLFNADEHAALAAFLEKADLIKFARLHATAEDSGALLDQAERLVNAADAPPPLPAPEVASR